MLRPVPAALVAAFLAWPAVAGPGADLDASIEGLKARAEALETGASVTREDILELRKILEDALARIAALESDDPDDPPPPPPPPGQTGNPGFPEVPSNPDVVLNPGDNIVAAFNTVPDGGVMLINPGIYPMGELGIRDVDLKPNATYYLRDGAWFEGWRKVEGWRKTGDRWRAKVPAAVNADKGCFCGDEGRYVDKRNPLATNREVLIRRPKSGDLSAASMLIEVKEGLNQNNWRTVDGKAEIAWDPVGYDVYVTHSDYFADDNSSGIKIYAESHDAGFRGFAPPTHQGAVKVVSTGDGPVFWGGVYEFSHAAGLRAACALVENVVLRWNGMNGMLGQQTGIRPVDNPSGNICKWPRQSSVTFEYRNDDGELVEATETFNDNVTWSQLYENNLLKFRTGWAAGGAKNGLGSQHPRFAHNVAWGNDGPDLWVDNIGGGCAIMDNNRLLGSRVGGGLVSEFQQRLPVINGSGECKFSVLYYRNWIVHKWPGFKLNQGALKVSRQPDAGIIQNILVIDGFNDGKNRCGDGLVSKQRDAAVGTGIFQNNDNAFTDNVVVHRHPCDTQGWHGFTGVWLDRQRGFYGDLENTFDWNTHVFQEGNDRRRFMSDLSDNGRGDNNESRVDFRGFQALGFEKHGQEVVVPDLDAWMCANHREAFEALQLGRC